MDNVEYIARENTDANEDLVLVLAAVHSVSIRRCPSSSCFNLVVSASSASIHRRSSSSRRCYRPLRLCRCRIQSRSIRIEIIGEASIQHEVLSVVLLPFEICSDLFRCRNIAKYL